MKRFLVLVLAAIMACSPIANAAEEKPPSYTPIESGYTIRQACVESIADNLVTFNIYRSEENGGSFTRDFDARNIDLSELCVEDDYFIFYKGTDDAPEQLDYVINVGYYSEESKHLTIPTMKEVEFLVLINVLQGYEDGKYHLDQSLTRAEFAAMLMRTLQIEMTQETLSSTPLNDIRGHWAENEMTQAYNLGIIKGTSENAFSPESPVTYAQMVAMVVRAIGLTDYAESHGGYPNGYFETAISLKLIYTYSYAYSSRAAKRFEVVTALCNIINFIPEDVHITITSGIGRGAKPVIYLYPEQAQQVDVWLNLKGKFTFTYPEYNSGWSVMAQPDGTLTTGGKEYSYLFWEGTMPALKPDFSEGFVVSREDTVSFLQETLALMGLTPREYNEFIVYWSPKMQENNYNKVYFANAEYEDNATLTISPKPDSMLRVFMVYAPANEGDTLPAQQLNSFKREGFTVVEWGGMDATNLV